MHDDLHVDPGVVRHAAPLGVHLLHVPPGVQPPVPVGGLDSVASLRLPRVGARISISAILAPRVPSSGVQPEPLFDGHGRRISDLRVSVTDRCNFRCQYCMPADGLPWLERAEILSFEEIERLVRLLAAMGVERRAPDRRRAARAARLPAPRRRCSRAMPGWRTSRSPRTATCSSATPTRSSRPASTRVNVSIDSLQRDRFFQITRRDSLPQVLRGLEALAAPPERCTRSRSTPWRMRGFTEEEAIPFAEFARSTAFQVRFIEFMPLDGDHAWSARPVLTGDELRAIIHARPPARGAAARAVGHRARVPLRRRQRARSASSTRCPSRSAPTATASA